MKKEQEKDSQHMLHKILVMFCSLIIVGTIVTVFYTIQKRQLIQENAAEMTEEEAVVVWEGGTEEAKAVMSQDKMEQEIAKHKQIFTEEETETLEDSTEGEKSADEVTIDFVGLQNINPDVYAWISIPGTQIEYPILQSPTDDTYYLNYNIDGSYGYPGCIYTEKANAKDFSDPNTVIYGHNMKNGTMFADLHHYEDQEFFNKNRDIIIYTPDKTYYYKIFAAYVYDDRHLLYSFDFKDKAVFEAYLQDIYARRDMNTILTDDISVTSDDKIITLATCMGQQKDKRLLVQAVLQ